MSDIAISVQGLGKRYRLGSRSRSPNGRGSLLLGPTRAIRNLIADVRNPSDAKTIWALKDVTFDVKRGEVLGIIGRNGAGKTTLLKILSQITEPTEGRAIINGRIGSLLEVGTGFHPELTGRENIYLSGAILGMKKAEIDRKFDEIVGFAEIERFIDTPVKRYSSGMYVRLAFAVAAHLEPEILLVDEVLAVGDAAFRKKCIGKMGDVASIGRTVLFVSHNMGVIREVARRGIWLDSGRVICDVAMSEAVSRYLSHGRRSDEGVVCLADHPTRLPGMLPILRQISCMASDGKPRADFSQSDTIVLELEYSALDDTRLAGAGFIIFNFDGVRVGGFNTYMAYPPPHRLPQTGSVRFLIAGRQFTPGRYSVTVSLGSHPGVLVDKVESAILFEIHPSDIYGTGYLLTREDGIAALDVATEVEDQAL